MKKGKNDKEKKERKKKHKKEIHVIKKEIGKRRKK